jgi:hypothetical protein
MVNVKSVPTTLNCVFKKYDEEIQSLNLAKHLCSSKVDETNDDVDSRNIFILDCYISRLRNTIFMSDIIINKLTKDNPDLLKEVLQKINDDQEQEKNQSFTEID